jgi:hypothetical protein
MCFGRSKPSGRSIELFNNPVGYRTTLLYKNNNIFAHGQEKPLERHDVTRFLDSLAPLPLVS